MNYPIPIGEPATVVVEKQQPALPLLRRPLYLKKRSGDPLHFNVTVRNNPYLIPQFLNAVKEKHPPGWSRVPIAILFSTPINKERKAAWYTGLLRFVARVMRIKRRQDFKLYELP